jgi:hypothetical protein
MNIILIIIMIIIIVIIIIKTLRFPLNIKISVIKQRSEFS